MKRHQPARGGFTLVELLVTMLLIGMVAASMLTLFVSLVRSAVVAKRQAVASTLATNQMEYLKSLPYNSLAVVGGSIYSATPLPATKTQTIDGTKYTITTSISYVDDSYDGCGSYPNITLKQQYCRNYPPPSGAPSTDTNPSDYKVLDVSVTDPANLHLAEVNTQVSARVSETASTTGALFVKIIDDTGNAVSGATANVTNTTLTPQVNLSDSTDSNGIAIFYGLPVDSSGYDYKISGSKSSYSSLTTIIPSGSLSPTYPSQNILTQSSSYVTLTIKPMNTHSIVIEATDTTGAPLANVKVYVKGGYKKYTNATNTTYYYDTLSPADIRPITDSNGLTALTSLVPGNYIFCGDLGATSCQIGATTYYLAAAIPYSGNNSFNPISVPSYDSSSPPATTYSYNGDQYLQKVRLMLTTSSSFPRVQTITPDDVSLSSGTITNFAFTISGANLPCSSNAASCSTTVKFTRNSTVYTASCTGDNVNANFLSCSVNLSGATAGLAELTIVANGNTLTIPESTLLGGINVTP